VPKQLNSGRITAALQRAFGFKGRYIPMLDEVIVPVYILADPSPADVTRLCAGTIGQIQNLPSNFPLVQLFNPLGSGVICNVTSVVAQCDVKEEVRIAVNSDQGTTAGQAFFRDTRNLGRPGCQIRGAGDNSSFVGNLLAVVQVDGSLAQDASWATASNDPRQPLTVLAPGDGLILQIPELQADALIVGNFQWLEIPITEVNPLGGIP